MISKIQVDMLIGILSSILAALEALDPELKDNAVIQQIHNAIAALQALGL